MCAILGVTLVNFSLIPNTGAVSAILFKGEGGLSSEEAPWLWGRVLLLGVGPA